MQLTEALATFKQAAMPDAEANPAKEHQAAGILQNRLQAIRVEFARTRPTHATEDELHVALQDAWVKLLTWRKGNSREQKRLEREQANNSNISPPRLRSIVNDAVADGVPAFEIIERLEVFGPEDELQRLIEGAYRTQNGRIYRTFETIFERVVSNLLTGEGVKEQAPQKDKYGTLRQIFSGRKHEGWGDSPQEPAAHQVLHHSERAMAPENEALRGFAPEDMKRARVRLYGSETTLTTELDTLVNRWLADGRKDAAPGRRLAIEHALIIKNWNSEVLDPLDYIFDKQRQAKPKYATMTRRQYVKNYLSKQIERARLGIEAKKKSDIRKGGLLLFIRGLITDAEAAGDDDEATSLNDCLQAAELDIRIDHEQAKR